MNKLLTLLLIVMCSALSAQENDNYKPLRSAGQLPPSFTLPIDKQVLEEQTKLTSENKKPVNQSQKDFLWKSQFSLDNMLLSGRVLVNDPLGVYVNKVADKLLENDPALRSQLHFYVFKSAQVNAYSYHQGIVLVNVGLIAQVENEAQLAYILSHEIAHFVKRHAINSYIEFKDIDEVNYDQDRFNAQISYSQDNESEADLEGLNIYKRSGYSLKEVIKAYDVLQYSYLPFDDVEFNKNFFEDQNLAFSDTIYSLKEVSPIVSDDNFDDSKSTHPNIRKRKNALDGKIGSDDSGRKKYLCSQEEFKKAQVTARFELCRLQLISRNYTEAVYSAYMLLKKYPGNVYLKKIICSALYNMAAYRAPGSTIDYDNRIASKGGYSLPDYKRIEGNSQQLYYFFSQLSDEEFTTMALSWSWKLKKQYPQEKYVSRVCDSLFVLMAVHNLTPAEFYTKSKEQLKKEMNDLRVADSLKRVAQLNDTTSDDGEEESKYDKIKKKKTQEVIKTAEIKGSMYFAFVDLLQDKEFRERYNHFVDQHNSSVHAHSTEEKKYSSSRPGLGIDHLIVYDPLRLRIDMRHGKKMNYLTSDKNEKQFADLIRKNCVQSKMQMQLFDPESMDSLSMQAFNDYEVLTDWLNETIETAGNKYALPLATEDIELVAQKYGSTDLYLTGVVNQRFKRIENPGLFIAGFLLWPLIPIYIIYAVIPRYQTFYYDILLDMKSGKVRYKSSDQVASGDSPANLNTRTSKTINLFKRKPPEKKG